MDKALAFRHKNTGEVFYFERITTRLESITRKRVVVAVGFKQNDMTRSDINADVLFGPNSLWEYKGPMVWEG